MGTIRGEVTCPRCSEASRGISEGEEVSGIGILDPTGAAPDTEEPDGPHHPLSKVLNCSPQDSWVISRAYCQAAQSGTLTSRQTQDVGER